MNRELRPPTAFTGAWRETPKVSMFEFQAACDGILVELRLAEKKHLGWPDDPMQQACIVAEEAGEACRAATEMVYRDTLPGEFEKELRQTAAVCIRALAWIREARRP